MASPFTDVLTQRLAIRHRLRQFLLLRSGKLSELIRIGHMVKRAGHESAIGLLYRIVASEYTVIRAGMVFRAAFINIFRTDDNAAVSFGSPPVLMHQESGRMTRR